MIAQLDVLTLAMSASLVFSAVTIILLLVFLTRRVYDGFGYWVVWQACATVGVLLFALRDPAPSPEQMVLTNIALLSAPPLLFHGMARFYGLYEGRAPILANYALAAAAIGAQVYFSVASPDLDMRVAVYTLTRSIILTRCGLEPLRMAPARRSASFWALVAVLAAIVANDMHHFFLALQPGPVILLEVSDSMRRALVAAVAADIIAAYVLVLLNSERLEAELLSARQDIELLARTDSLTGLWNRRHFEDRIAEEYERAARYGAPLSLLSIDADHFKRINDERGHHAGDDVLRELAEVLTRQIRRSDLLCRWGGEEFMVLVPETDADRATAMAEKIRQHVEGHRFANGERVTVSIGVGKVARGEPPESWLRRVDAALYEAKQQGRNRVVTADTDPVSQAAQ